MVRLLAAAFLLIALAGCGGTILPLSFQTPVAVPSATPFIRSPTPIIVAVSSTPILITASLTPTSTLTASVTDTPTATQTPTATSTALPQLGLIILDCNTSVDILHGMGEVTNAFPLIRNQGKTDLTNVCATLSASDEGRVHPDKTYCLASLAAGYEVMFKLTVDSTFRQGSLIHVNVTSQEGVTSSVSQDSCLAIGLPYWAPEEVGVARPIPK